MNLENITLYFKRLARLGYSNKHTAIVILKKDLYPHNELNKHCEISFRVNDKDESIFGFRTVKFTYYIFQFNKKYICLLNLIIDDKYIPITDIDNNITATFLNCVRNYNSIRDVNIDNMQKIHSISNAQKYFLLIALCIYKSCFINDIFISPAITILQYESLISHVNEFKYNSININLENKEN